MKDALFRKPRLATLAAFALYSGTALVLTWPMAANLTTQVYGGGGDAFGAIATLRELRDSGVIPFLPGTLQDLAAPEGREWAYPLSVASWASTGPRWLLTLVFGALPGWNLWVLIGYVATGLATFLLVRRLTGSLVAALIAGWAYAFYPFAAIRGGAHVDYMHGWPLVVLLWRLLEVRWQPSVRNGLWAGGAFVLCLSFTPYLILFSAVAVATFIASDLLLAWREKDMKAHVKAWASGMWMAPAMLAAFVAVNSTYGRSQIREYPLSEATFYAARPLDYLVPVPSTGLLGDNFFTQFYARGIASGERGIYLGWTTLILASITLVALVRRRFDGRTARTIGLVAAVGLVAAFVSGPPYFQHFGVTINMPSYYIFELSSTWRVYARFVMVVMLVAVIIAAYGIAFLLRNRSLPAATVIAVAVGGLVYYDLWWHPPGRVSSPPHPRVYDTLAANRDGKLVAEYPLSLDITPDYRPAMGQDLHGHRLLNGYGPDTFQEDRAVWLQSLDEPRTAGRLAALGVGWVIVNEGDPYPDLRPPGPPGKGFQPVESKDGRALYKVTAAPLPTLAYPFEGFGGPEGEIGNRSAWLTESEGTIEVEARGCLPRPCAGELRFTVSSFAVERRMTLSAPGARPMSWTVPAGPSLKVRYPLQAGTRTSVRFEVTPEGQTPRSINGTPDDRKLTVTVTEPKFVLSAS